MTATPLWQYSASVLATRLRAGEVSCEAVVGAHLARLQAVDERCRVLVATNPEALAAARAADLQRQAGAPIGTLHGVPFTVKDWLQTAGLPAGTSFGGDLAAVARRDASAVARLRAAGAILLGKTRADGPADTAPGPLNPHDHAHSCGGSSSGEAAAIAAGGSPLGLGSDSGGSIRWPAHCCGIAGLKPTQGRVPLTGHVPPIIALTDPRTVVGPLARSVADLELALHVINGPDGEDASVVPVPLTTSQDVNITGLRFAVVERFDGVTPTADTLAALDDAVRVLQARGAVLTELVPPRLAEAYAITKAYWSRLESTSWAQWRAVGEHTLAVAELEQSLFAWDRLRRGFTEFMTQVDLIMMPVAAAPAPALRAAKRSDYAYTLAFSLTGQPVVSVRAGTSSSGLPIGVQVAARAFDDHVALAAARCIEKDLGPWPIPDIDPGRVE